MSGDHNQYQKDKSYLDGMDRYKQVRELVKDLSLRVTEIAWKTGYNKGHVSRLRKEAMRQALDTEQEPVAWISDSPTKGNGKQLHWTKSEAWRWSSNITPLYTAPCQTCQSLAMAVMNDQTYHEKVIPKREWVGLTDEEHDSIKRNYHNMTWTLEMFARAIEAKLKEKNHG